VVAETEEAVVADYSTLLRDHVTLTCRSVDRIFLRAYVPKLQSVGWVCQFLRWQRGFVIPSSAAFGKIGDAYVRQVHRFAETNAIPVVHFGKGDNKEAIARPLIDAAAAAGGEGRVVLIGIAQEKAPVWRSWKAKGQEHAAHPHMEWGRQMAFVNHFYFYLWDPEWGGAFWKTNGYAPYPIWIWLNGHTWAQRQCDKAGIGYTALDNGFASCTNPKALQRICDRLGSGAVKSFFWRWLRRLPSPFTTADLRAGYGYELAFRQFEVSDTRVFDRPAAGRAFFEGVIRDHLDLGRPSSVALIFDRRVNSRTPGSFRTKVITKGSTRSSCATTGPAGSSSTSSNTGRCAPRPSSATPATSASAGGSTPPTGTPSGRLATTPTSVYATRKQPTPNRHPMWSPSTR
jgi:hypothetical protein